MSWFDDLFSAEARLKKDNRLLKLRIEKAELKAKLKKIEEGDDEGEGGEE